MANIQSPGSNGTRLIPTFVVKVLPMLAVLHEFVKIFFGVSRQPFKLSTS